MDLNDRDLQLVDSVNPVTFLVIRMKELDTAAVIEHKAMV